MKVIWSSSKVKKNVIKFWKKQNSYDEVSKMKIENMIKYRICNILTKTRFLKILFWFERMCVFWSHENVRKIYAKMHEFCMNDMKCVNMKLLWMNKKQNKWNSNYDKFSWINEVQTMINFHE